MRPRNEKLKLEKWVVPFCVSGIALQSQNNGGREREEEEMRRKM